MFKQYKTSTPKFYDQIFVYAVNGIGKLDDEFLVKVESFFL